MLRDIEHYRPRRKGWTWRKKIAHQILGPFDYRQTSESLERSIPLPAAHYFGNIDPQPDCVITTEIASGRFEDDIRRMRMAAWHGADHMMVIRTAGQSHFDGLLEGTPEGVGWRAHQPQAGAGHAQGAGPDRGRGRPAHQLPQLRLRRGRP